MRVSFASGRTEPGKTNWIQDGPTRIYVDIITGIKDLASAPTYVVSLGGENSHHKTVGGNVVGCPTAKGFRIALEWADGHPLTPAEANTCKWHVLWMAQPTLNAFAGDSSGKNEGVDI